MHIEALGQGPVVVLMHGAPQAPAYFDSLAAVLARSRRVLVPHFPGYSKSAPARSPYSLEAVEQELAEDLRSLGVTEAAIVGTSMGAWRALALVLHGRVRATRVMLLGGFASLTAAHAESLQAMGKSIGAMADFRDPVFRRQIASLFLAPANATPSALLGVESWLDTISPLALADELSSVGQMQDLHPLLAQLKAPLLLHVGELDVAVPPSYSESMVAALPGAVLQRVPGIGHLPLIEDEAATIAAICRFLEV